MSNSDQLVCGKCGRTLVGEVSRCVYCGWTKDQALQRIADAGKVQKETFRSGSTVWPFLASAFILTGLAGLVAMSGVRNASDHREVFMLWGTMGALLFFGPVLCSVQLLKRKLIWVHVDPENGIKTATGRWIPWDRIASIQRYPGAFAYKDNLEQLSGQMPHGTVAYRFGCAILPVLVIYFVFLPVIAVLSPWHDRVTIILKNDERIILRDLEDSDRFTRMVRYKIE
jgi:hypothetical protein